MKTKYKDPLAMKPVKKCNKCHSETGELVKGLVTLAVVGAVANAIKK